MDSNLGLRGDLLKLAAIVTVVGIFMGSGWLAFIGGVILLPSAAFLTPATYDPG